MSTIPLDLEADTVVLPSPAFPAGASLEDALKQRRSERVFRNEALPLETVATLLWAGCGLNRPASGHRTSPSAHNWQEISVYAVMAEGAYRYDPAGHRLLLVDAQDLRHLTGLQDFVGAAPLNLMYVADFARMRDCPAQERSFFAGADAAFVAQNILLCCAGAGLSTVVRALIDRRALAAALRLSQTERIALAQTIGLPAPAP
jgi:nitroreductase